MFAIQVRNNSGRDRKWEGDGDGTGSIAAVLVTHAAVLALPVGVQRPLQHIASGLGVCRVNVQACADGCSRF